MSTSDRAVNFTRRALRKLGVINQWTTQIAHFPQRAPEIDCKYAEVYFKHEGRLAHKWDHYLRVYERYLAPYHGRKFRFLEIGVRHGGSLQVWRELFGPEAIIFGIDIDPRCAVIDDPPGVNVRIGSQTDTAFLESVIREMGGIDVVLDDGSHVTSHMRTSFNYLFPRLSPNGIYIAEDTHTNYWRGEYEGGWRRRSTFIEQMKDLVDDMHSWWHKKPQSLVDAHKTIEALHFYDSMVVIEKRPKPSPAAYEIGKPSFDTSVVRK